MYEAALTANQILVAVSETLFSNSDNIEAFSIVSKNTPNFRNMFAKAKLDFCLGKLSKFLWLHIPEIVLFNTKNLRGCVIRELEVYQTPIYKDYICAIFEDEMFVYFNGRWEKMLSASVSIPSDNVFMHKIREVSEAFIKRNF